MSQTEETPKATQEPEAAVDATANFADELEIVDAMKPAPATASTNKPLKYGNRKKKAGETGPNIQSLGSISSLDEEEEIEMDDLPVRANVPEAMIDTRTHPSESRDDQSESRPRRQNRSRGERRERKPRERAPEKTEATAANETAEASTEDAAPEQGRPDRFGTVKRSQSTDQVEEFRPSRDGRTAPKRERRPRTEPVAVAKPKKKGLLSKIISFFTGGEEKEEKQSPERNKGPRNRKGGGRRNPQNRSNRNSEGEEGDNNGNRRRRRRPRNRKPRPDGEAGPKPRGDREGGNGNNNRRRRRPRRQGQGNRERQQTTSE